MQRLAATWSERLPEECAGVTQMLLLRRGCVCRSILCWNIVFGSLPSLVRIVTVHRFELLQRVLAEVFFVDHAVRANDERLHTCHPVLRRCGGEGEATDHRSANHEVHFTHRR